jgi:phosphatidate cytidylyltransferase
MITVGVAGLLFLGMLGLAALWLKGGQAGYTARTWMLSGLVPVITAIWLFVVTPTVLRARTQACPSDLSWALFAPPACLAAWSVLVLLFIDRGAGFVLSLLALVWVVDIGAYFAGRAFGRRKLAPTISPGKTVAGAVAGVFAAIIWMVVSSFWDTSFAFALVKRWTFWLAIPLTVLLALLCIVGDLFESLLKRRVGYKDSSTLLPGHGGVFDRLDAVLALAPVAAILSGALS